MTKTQKLMNRVITKGECNEKNPTKNALFNIQSIAD